MQTFLPYPDFLASARALDQKRLGKQRVEAIQVLRGLTRPGYGWRNHPAVKMWAGYEEALTRYGLDMCAVWCEPGRADTCAATLLTDLAAACGVSVYGPRTELAAAGELPPWLGRDDLHLQPPRRRCCARTPEHYRPLFGDDDLDPDLEYVWPPSDRAAPSASRPEQAQTRCATVPPPRADWSAWRCREWWAGSSAYASTGGARAAVAPTACRDRRTAVVVGGGIAGMSAAVVLAERGVAVTVLEAAPHARRPAGRVAGGARRRQPASTSTASTRSSGSTTTGGRSCAGSIRRWASSSPIPGYPILSEQWPTEEFGRLPPARRRTCWRCCCAAPACAWPTCAGWTGTPRCRCSPTTR